MNTHTHTHSLYYRHLYIEIGKIFWTKTNQQLVLSVNIRIFSFFLFFPNVINDAYRIDLFSSFVLFVCSYVHHFHISIPFTLMVLWIPGIWETLITYLIINKSNNISSSKGNVYIYKDQHQHIYLLLIQDGCSIQLPVCFCVILMVLSAI